MTTVDWAVKPQHKQTNKVWTNSVDPDHTALEESDQDLHCLPFCPHLLDVLLYNKTMLFKLLDNCSNFLGVRIFRIFLP